jgi:hypothetical protein
LNLPPPQAGVKQTHLLPQSLPQPAVTPSPDELLALWESLNPVLRSAIFRIMQFYKADKQSNNVDL